MHEQAPTPTSSPAGSTRDFRDPAGPDLLARVAAFHAWQQSRSVRGLWPYSRALRAAPATTTDILDARGEPQSGVNFASQDYLSLATAPAVKAAATAAIGAYGVHSAGSAAVLGNTDISLRLEAALGEFLGTPHVTLYPTGWAAGFGVPRGLVRPADYIVIDALAHTCLQEGALASTRKISTFRHLDLDHARSLLARIRKQDRENGILLVTEALFSMDSDSPDIAGFQAACREHRATLMVDVAHDLGALGPGGTGVIGAQNMTGQVDIVMGSFSKTFASNGGFVATHSPAVKQFLKIFSPSQTFSNALSPAQAATVLEALQIVRRPEGESLRGRLMANILALREKLVARDMRVMGTPSPIVPVPISSRDPGRAEESARLAARALPGLGVLANLVEFPAVPQGLPRFRLQVMAGHGDADTTRAATAVAAAVAGCRDVAA